MASKHLFRFGVLNETMLSQQHWLAQARKAEELGYATFLIRDHFVSDFGGATFSPVASMMAAANATQTLRTGTLVIDNDFRHPIVLAKEVATLDQMSGGRFELGLGAGKKRMCQLAGREADIVGLLTISTSHGTFQADPVEMLASTITQKINWVREGAGERFPEIELSMMISICITENPQQYAEQLIQENKWHDISVEQVLDMPSKFFGSIDQIVEQMEARRERFGFSYYIVTDKIMDTLAPIVAQLTGK